MLNPSKAVRTRTAQQDCVLLFLESRFLMEYDTDLVNKKGKDNTAGNTGVKKICKV